MRGWLCVMAVGMLAGCMAARGETAPDRVELGVDVALSRGESDWEIVFFEDLFGEGRSILKWEDLDAATYGLHGIVNLSPWFSLAAAYAEGDIEDARNTDTDTISDIFLGVDDFVFSRSESDTDGELESLQGDIRFHLDQLKEFAGWPGRLYLLVGYQTYDENLRDRNGVQTIIDEEVVEEPFDGLDNTFDFSWSAVRVGAGGTFELTPTLAIRAQGALLLNVEYEGEGYWNLRDEFRATPPNFIQEGDDGNGADLRASLAWRPLPNLLLEGGLWHLRWQVEEGFDRTFFADGTAADSQLVSAESKRTGGFLSASVLF
jgi:hypothetical protein